MAKDIDFGPGWLAWARRWIALGVVILLGWGAWIFASAVWTGSLVQSGMMCCFVSMTPAPLVGLLLDWISHTGAEAEAAELREHFGWRGTVWLVRFRFGRHWRKALLGCGRGELAVVPLRPLPGEGPEEWRERRLVNARRWPLEQIRAIEYKPAGAPWRVATRGAGAIHLLLEDESWVALWTERPRRGVEVFRRALEAERA